MSPYLLQPFFDRWPKRTFAAVLVFVLLMWGLAGHFDYLEIEP